MINVYSLNKCFCKGPLYVNAMFEEGRRGGGGSKL